jgi:hypothetical protein
MWTFARACSGGCARAHMERGGYRCGVRVGSICFIDCWRRTSGEHDERGRQFIPLIYFDTATLAGF